MRFINVYTAENSFEANFIKEELMSDGIECILTNENFTSLMPHLNGMLGAGIQVLVNKDDVDVASQIIGERTNRVIRSCPNCASENISYGFGTQHRMKRVIAMIISVVTFAPTNHIKKTYFCNECQMEFGR